jgi:hypothetical protein
MLKTVEFKSFSEILLTQVDGGVSAHDVDWSPIMETAMLPLEYGTPHKVKIQAEPVSESLEDLGWTDVLPIGASTLEEDSYPSFNDSLRTNQLVINLKLMRLNVETLERRLSKVLISYEETLESLGSQIHATRVQVGKYSGIYTSGEDSVWEGIAGVHVKVDSTEGRIRSEIMAAIMPMIGWIKSDTTAGTAALVQREVALATMQLMSQLQDVRHKHSVTVSNLETDLARIVGRGGLSSGQHVCSALNSDFPADWGLVLDFLGRHTSPGSGRVGDNIEDCVDRSDIGSSLPGDPWTHRANSDQSASTLASAKVLNLQKEIADLRDRISSNSVPIDSFILPSLSKKVAWCVQHLPGDVDEALICMDDPSFLHGIGRELSSNQDTRESLYQNKKAGISSFSLTLHSSFSTVLPEIIGKVNNVGFEYNGLLLPRAKT